MLVLLVVRARVVVTYCVRCPFSSSLLVVEVGMLNVFLSVLVACIVVIICDRSAGRSVDIPRHSEGSSVGYLFPHVISGVTSDTCGG